MRRFVAFAVQGQSGPLPALLAISVLAYALLSLLPEGGFVAGLCGNLSIGAVWFYISAVPWSWTVGPLAADWGLMIVAMMTPLVAPQVARIVWASRRERQLIAAAIFLLGYWVIWFLTMVVLIPAAMLVTWIFGADLDLLAALAVALVWSASPSAQRARNLCHRTRPIRAFGPGVLMDSAQRGLSVGASCIAACWPWMLVPIAVQSVHLATMILVGAYLFADRIAPPARATWRLPPAFETLCGSSRPWLRFRLGTRIGQTRQFNLSRRTGRLVPRQH